MCQPLLVLPHLTHNFTVNIADDKKVVVFLSVIRGKRIPYLLALEEPQDSVPIVEGALRTQAISHHRRSLLP